ncbi:MAG TPA: hypothetical protein VIJ36_09135 [Thermoanaerobaculia bacterium]|jgi:hypothetical protein
MLLFIDFSFRKPTAGPGKEKRPEIRNAAESRPSAVRIWHCRINDLQAAVVSRPLNKVKRELSAGCTLAAFPASFKCGKP